MKPSTPYFSIVIPSLNEEKYLPNLLADLAAQTYTNFEVIHVDGTSEDTTVATAKTFAKQIRIKTYSTKVRNVSFQRNTGMSKATGEWIVCMDADNRLTPTFLAELAESIERAPETDLFTTWITVSHEKIINHSIEATVNFWLELAKVIGKEWSFGALIGVRRKLVTPEFYFDEKQKVAEDSIFVKKLIDAGHSFSLFRTPRYTYSVRRFTAEGNLVMLQKGALIALNHFTGKDFTENDFGYKMEGGNSYEPTEFSTLSNIQSFLKNATEKQLSQAKELFSSLRKFGL